MFKSDEQVETFINYLEKFVKAIVMSPPGVDYAANLNKHRDGLESFVKVVCGITALSNTTDKFLCPDCGNEMALRTNRQHGNKFYGCLKYPSCRGTRDENGLSKEEREESKYKKEQAVQEGGFSFNKDKRRFETEVSPPTQWINPFAK